MTTTAPKLIGIGHQMQVGKDTVAQFLVERHGYHRIGFADAVKELAELINPMLFMGLRLRELLASMSWEEIKKSPEGRALLQDIGLGCREVLGPDVWVNALQRKIRKSYRYVVPDVRFPNEADALAMAGAKLVKIERPGRGGVNHDHVSELALSDWKGWDLVVVNDGSLSDLYARIEEGLFGAQSREGGGGGGEGDTVQ